MIQPGGRERYFQLDLEKVQLDCFQRIMFKTTNVSDLFQYTLLSDP